MGTLEVIDFDKVVWGHFKTSMGTLSFPDYTQHRTPNHCIAVRKMPRQSKCCACVPSAVRCKQFRDTTTLVHLAESVYVL